MLLNRPKAETISEGNGSIFGRINHGIDTTKSYTMIVGDRIFAINQDGSFYIQNMLAGSYSYTIWDGTKEYDASSGNEQMLFIEPNIRSSLEIDTIK
ncbi:hypothetical protein AUK41_02615 [Candidatus Berkelbacteria bacterium CG2_30_43_20]|uniref:Uncharacterized protein n=1 Tax=Candidatus Berkelbacteria bacterium CG10_big_fil_rev_8_21_14_0_10_43_14 TaxID=1974515 RepID=A0A2M6R9K0_9BACT|nr:MAG: hypothetical protein AUK41_02615 [Candidatus Berkelbacteria bacterium CG2_30_43_20]PIS07222.1 MAG: hypothetical protein COT79_00375 [Candidatus Berkelbacteria bacterium CG10_big_fil_rev_8_21_14_0_10_43_14]